MTVNVKVAKLHPEARLPNYAHRGPFGDLAADVSALEAAELAPGEIKAIPHRACLRVSPGIRRARRGPLGIGFERHLHAGRGDRSRLPRRVESRSDQPGQRTLSNKCGDRIAQLRIVRRVEVEFTEVDSVSSTERDARGFGSTGT